MPSPEHDYATLHARLGRQARALGAMILETPPGLSKANFGETDGGLARMALKLRLLGKAEMRDLLRIVLSTPGISLTTRLVTAHWPARSRWTRPSAAPWARVLPAPC